VVLSWALQRTKSIDMNHLVVRWLVLLGQNSLPVFVWSILLNYVMIAVQRSHAPLGMRIGDLLFAAASLSIPALVSARVSGGAANGVFPWRSDRVVAAQ
jgi:OpgC protein